MANLLQPRPRVPRQFLRVQPDTRAYQHERRRKQLRSSRTATVHASMLEQSSRDMLAVTAQLIEAACRARDGDSDGYQSTYRLSPERVLAVIALAASSA
jgi:hypothetical protein